MRERERASRSMSLVVQPSRRREDVELIISLLLPRSCPSTLASKPSTQSRISNREMRRDKGSELTDRVFEKEGFAKEVVGREEEGSEKEKRNVESGVFELISTRIFFLLLSPVSDSGASLHCSRVGHHPEAKSSP